MRYSFASVIGWSAGSERRYWSWWYMMRY